MTKSARGRENRTKEWRAFPKNHPLFNTIRDMRNEMETPWADIVEYAREQGHSLTAKQIVYGFEKAGVDFTRHTTPWVNASLKDWKDRKFPAIEMAVVALVAEANDIQRIGDHHDR